VSAREWECGGRGIGSGWESGVFGCLHKKHQRERKEERRTTTIPPKKGTKPEKTDHTSKRKGKSKTVTANSQRHKKQSVKKLTTPTEKQGSVDNIETGRAGLGTGKPGRSTYPLNSRSILRVPRGVSIGGSGGSTAAKSKTGTGWTEMHRKEWQGKMSVTPEN